MTAQTNYDYDNGAEMCYLLNLPVVQYFAALYKKLLSCLESNQSGGVILFNLRKIILLHILHLMFKCKICHS